MSEERPGTLAGIRDRRPGLDPPDAAHSGIARAVLTEAGLTEAEIDGITVPAR